MCLIDVIIDPKKNCIQYVSYVLLMLQHALGHIKVNLYTNYDLMFV